jgi:uncharacterized pyridoxal phosphate-containing UPF0001 family protein
MFNQEVLEKINKTKSKLVLVTKYFNAVKTREILAEIKKEHCFLALGENRIDDIIAKNLPREVVHFIGNIQSRRIGEISENCSVIHSLCDLKHAKLFAKQETKCQFFIQVNVSGEESKNGILPEDFAGFYESLPPELEIIGISGMGKGVNFTREEKIAEFQILLNLREKFNPNWKISAGTSADYEIALEMGIDIVRVGREMFK